MQHFLDVTITINENTARHIMNEAAGYIAFILICFIPIMIFMIVTFWKIFSKAGQPGWASIVPIYNIICMLRIAGKPEWWIFLLLIPFANIYFGIVMINKISKAFGKDEAFTVGLILLSWIFFPILAFGKSKFIGPGGITPESQS